MTHKQIIVISFLAVSLLLAADTTRADNFSGKPIKLLVRSHVADASSRLSPSGPSA